MRGPTRNERSDVRLACAPAGDAWPDRFLGVGDYCRADKFDFGFGVEEALDLEQSDRRIVLAEVAFVDRRQLLEAGAVILDVGDVDLHRDEMLRGAPSRRQ